MSSTALMVGLPERVARALERPFERAGYRWTQVQGALDESILATDRYDLVVLGCPGPGREPLELLRRLRQLPGRGRVAILVILETEEPESLSRILDAGADDCLHLPAPEAIVTARLRMSEILLEKRREQHRQSKVRELLFAIAQATGASTDLPGLLELIHDRLGQVMSQRNFYVALRAEGPARYDLPFCVDEADPSGRFYGLDLSGTLTDLVFRTETPRLTDYARDRELIRQGVIRDYETPSESWLGVPLRTPSGVIGVVVVQSYDPRLVYSLEDLDLLSSMSDFISIAIDRQRNLDTIREKTEQLEELVRELHQEIEERRRREAELELAKETAEEALRAKSRFVANMSHELRTPLNSVLGMAELLRTETLDDGSREHVEIIRKGGMRLLRLVDDVLDSAKLGSAKLRLEVQPFDLERCVERALELVRPGAAEKGLSLRSSIEASCPRWVLGDRFRLGQVLLNLLNNAVKFTDRGSVELLVTVRKELATELEEVREILVSVTDTGAGITREDLPHLFTPFSQVDGSLTRTYEGAGLGLSIAKQLVELMGGRIWVESEPQRGSSFRFALPLRRALGEPAALASPSPEPRGSAALSSLRLLVAEDNPDNQRVIRLMLKSLGHSVTVVDNGREALSELEASHFDVTLLDIQMPIMDGLEAARLIVRRWPSEKRPYLIAVTAHASEESRQRCLAAGFGAFLGKPVDIESLRLALDGAMEEQGA